WVSEGYQPYEVASSSARKRKASQGGAKVSAKKFAPPQVSSVSLSAVSLSDAQVSELEEKVGYHLVVDSFPDSIPEQYVLQDEPEGKLQDDDAMQVDDV
ncbi:hypothetical protein BGZ73_002648, partial [Actinomortierella ambigua]